MRKRMVTSLLMLIAVTVCFIAFAVGSSAMWTGELASEQREFSVPKVNVNNPAIVIDGNVNLDGEWYGALKTGIDLNNEDDADYYGIWDAGVWGNSMDYPIETYDDIVDKYRMTWDAYWLWDEDGLYFAVVCETDTSYTAYNPDWGFSRIDGFTPIFDATADDGDHTWQWLDFWAATTTGESYWCDDNLTYSSRSENCPYVIETASSRSTTPNAEGKYPWYIEGFLSWDSISYDTNGNRYASIDGEAGLTIEIGQIFFEGAGEYVPDESGTGWTDRPNYIRANDCPGWNNFNYYTMSAQPAARVYTDAPFAGTGEIVPSEIIVPKVSEPITIDGRFDEDDWGDSFIHVIASSRAEYEHVINPRDTFLDAKCGATTANSDWYFRYDDEYLYICAVVTKPYISENINGALWTNVDDMWHLYLGVDDGDDNGTNDPHCCFGIVANSDCSETWVNCFEQSMPDAGDTATVNESVRAAIGKSGLSSVYEIAVPIEDALGYSDLDEYDNICFFSGAFFFADDIGGIAYEVGEGVFWADKKPTASPFLIAGPLYNVTTDSGSLNSTAYWETDNSGTLRIKGFGMVSYEDFINNEDLPDYFESITSVTIDRGISFIDATVFINLLPNLEAINVDALNQKYFSIDGVLFEKEEDCNRLINYPRSKNGTSYTVPSGIQIVDAFAFRNNNYLTSVTLSETVRMFEASCFDGSINVINLSVDEDSLKLRIIDGVLYNYDVTRLEFYPRNKDSTEFTVPSTVEIIGNNSFANNRYIEKVTIPKSVYSIDYEAFMDSSIEEVCFEDYSYLFYINSCAFYNCDSLESITIPNGVEQIGWQAFASCDNLESVYFYGDTPSIETYDGASFDAGVTLYYIEGKAGWSSGWNGYTCTTFTDYPAYVIDPVIPSDSIADGRCGAYSYWSINNQNEFTVFGFGDIDIYYDYDNWNDCKEQIETVFIGKDITSIDDNAFADCTALESVTFEAGSQLESVEYQAFAGCEKLVSITIPATVTEIGYESFRNCSALESVTFEAGSQLETIGTFTFGWCSNLKLISIPASVKQICEGTFIENLLLSSVTFETGSQLEYLGVISFLGCEQLSSITIPASVKEIGERAFADCTALESVTFETGSQLESLGFQAFAGCEKLASITIPASVKDLGVESFYNCSALESVTFESGSQLKTISNNAFFECPELESVSFGTGSNIEVIGYNAFSRSGLSTITIPASVKEIREGAFQSCLSLETIIFESGSQLETIDRMVFRWCENLNSIIIPATVTEIGESAFDSCSALESVTFESGSQLETIGRYAFCCCYNLKSINIPATVREIGAYAFQDCTDFETVTFESGSQLETIGGYAFGWCSKLKSINIPATVREIGERAFVDCTALETVTFEDDSELTQIYEGAFLNSGITSITIPASVEAIGYNVFYSCRLLETVEFEENSQLTELGGGVFGLTHSLKSVTIPAGISEIDGGLFSWSSVENINILNSNFVKENGIVYNADKTEIIVAEKNITDIEIPSTVTKINSYAFCYCRKLTDLDFEDNSSLERICNSAFSDCDYLSIAELPASVKYLESEAFSGCDSLKTVTMQGVIGLGEYVFDNCSLLEKIVINNAYYISENGALLNAAKTEIYKYFGSGKEYTVPASVRTIKNGAFWNVSLSRLNFASGSLLETIEMNAISASNVKSLVIPASVTTIKAWGITIYGDTETIYFSGNAPVLEQNAITGNLRWLTIYYQQNSTGWENYSESYNLVAINGVSLDSVYVSNAPNKIKYEDNETVDITGVEITAMYSDGHTQVVTNFDYSPKGQLPEGCDVITFSYTENGTTCTATQGLKHSVVYAGTDETVPNEIRVGISNGIVIDGSFSEEEWGQPAIVAKARSRAENIKMINPRDTFSEAEEDILNADSEWYFKHDSENLYVAIVVDKPLVANTVGKNGTKSLWTDADDTLQLYIGITDDDDNNYNNPHVGFGIAADKDTHQTYVSCFEQSMPGAGDTSMTQESIVAQVGEQDGKTVYEFSMNISACFGNIVPETGNDIVNFSGAFFFDSDVPGACYQVGSGVLWADKSMNGCPLLVFDGKCGPCGDYAYWSIDDNGTLKISGQGAIDGVESETPQNIYNREESGILASPVQIYNGTKTETTTKGWQQYSNLITKIVIEEGITKIGENAFKGCSEIKSVEVPSTVKRIDEGAFSECSKLESVTLPEKIKTIGDGAFTDCANLESITFQGNVPELNSVGLDSEKVTLMTEEQVTGFTCCVRGDVDGVSGVTRSDAVYISYNINKLEFNQNIDFNGDGKQDEEDALYLMYNLFFPDEYKLK